jgi:hypothetical protein
LRRTLDWSAIGWFLARSALGAGWASASPRRPGWWPVRRIAARFSLCVLSPRGGAGFCSARIAFNSKATCSLTARSWPPAPHDLGFAPCAPRAAQGVDWRRGSSQRPHVRRSGGKAAWPGPTVASAASSSELLLAQGASSAHLALDPAAAAQQCTRVLACGICLLSVRHSFPSCSLRRPRLERSSDLGELNLRSVLVPEPLL